MLEETEVTCPYCWETIAIDVDLSVGSQRYTEDCSVCCQPILVHLHVDDQDMAWSVTVEAENG